jgi:hypothetical protein
MSAAEGVGRTFRGVAAPMSAQARLKQMHCGNHVLSKTRVNLKTGRGDGRAAPPFVRVLSSARSGLLHHKGKDQRCDHRQAEDNKQGRAAI